MTIRNSVLGVALAGLAPFAPTAVVGQTTSEDTSTLQERAEARGFKAESVYEVSEIDTINLFNGNLAINIPIGQEYSANGNLSYGLVLSYNSSIWDLREEMYPNEPECGPKGRCTPPHWMRAIPNPLSNAGLGWTLSLGSLFAPNQFTSGTSVKNLAIEVPLVNGAKGGTVVSDPEGIYCGALGAACTHGFLEGSTVSLATIEEPGWYFDRWEDGCFGGQEVMTGSRTCKAFFTQTPPGAARLDVYVNEGIYEGSGNGTVTSSPGSINCRKEDPQPCSETFTVGDTIQLTASPDGDSEFAYWSKGCGTTTPTTYVYMNGPARTCWAKFDLKTPTGTFDLDVTPGIGDVTVTASSLPNGVQVCSKAQTNGCIYEIDALDDVALAVDNITDPQCWEHSGWLQAQCDNFQMTSNKFCTARYKFICGGGGGGGGVAPGFLEGEPVNETGQWMYASPDGAKHLFYEFMQPSEDDNDETVFYSRDNTYLRLKTAGVTKILEFPDGAQHHFADKGAGIEYELTKIEDAHGNTLDISYSFDSSGNYIWDLQDSVGRTHKVTFEYTSLGYQVDTVDLAAFGGQRGVYDFVYVQTSIDRDCRDNDPATSKQILVPLLTTVILPEGGSYKFGDSANPGYVTECSGGIVPPEPTPPPPGFWQINMMPGSNVGSGGRITASFGALDCTIDENQQVSGTCSDDIPSGQALSLTIQLLGEANTMQWVSPSHEYCDDPSILGSDGETIDCTPAFFCAGTGCVGIPGPPPPPPVLPEPNQDGTPGNLLEAALPTRGTIEWDYGAYWLPQKGGPYIQGLVGVAERRHYDRGGTFLGKWTYNNEVDKQPEYTNDPSTWPTATWTDVVNPTGDCTRHYFSAHPRSTAWDWAYGLPFYHDDPEAEGRYYSTRVYAGNSGTVCDDGPGPIRSTAVEYAKDGEVEPPLTFGYNDHDAARYNRNRRLKESVTIFHDDGNRWIKTVNSDFDSLGHYRRSKTTGSLKSGDSRVSYTNYSLNATPMPIEKWLLTRFEYQSTTEGGNTARTDVQFNSDGFLECRRVRKNSGGRSTSDVLVVFTADNDGNVTQEDWYGGDVGSVGTASVCGSKGMRSYGIDHSYQYGSLKTSEYDNAPGNFFSYDATIDFNTGLASSTRDTAGIQTNFDYDLEGRLLEVQPALSACTTYTYTSATSSNPANVVVRKKPNSCNGTALLTEEFYFDGFGRVEKERREWPGTNLQDRVTKYNARGWKLSVTEWGSNSKTSFNGYDPFGRAGQIVAPDGSNVDFSYFGNRAIVRDSSVETSSGSTTVTTTEEYDSFGRLSKVTEGNGVTTQYEYDVGNRLSNVLINGAQERDFTYDNRGFLQNEKHPEKGAHGNGFVAYSNYDPKGYAGRKDDNGTTLTFTYDGAERLTKVEDDSSPPRLFKSFTYGSSASTTSLGKLEKTRRNNFIVPPGNTAETNFWVEEIYTYDAEGRVSELETTCSPYQMHQSFTYDELGGIADLEYPICDVTCASAPNQARTLTYEYQKGRVTKVTDSNLGIGEWVSNVSFNSNGILNTVTHGNGVIDHQDIATNGMRRPKRLYTTNVAEGLDWNSGDYAYDGSGNIKQIGQSLYVYDKLSRVVQGDLVELGKTQAYDYDVYGNIQSIVTNGSPRSTPTDSSTNRLKEPSGTLFKYDPRGNLQTWGAQEFHEYDEFNLIKQVRSGSDETDPVVRAHVYTADDERLLTIGLGFDYEFSLRDLDGRLLRIFKSDPATEAWSISLDNIWLEGRLVGFVEDGSEVHAHLDHLGTPRLHTDSEGSNIATFDYFPFGELAASTGQSDVRMKFTGHERDDSTIGTAAELDYMHARYFSAHFGRFTSVDSALSSAGPGNPSSWNRYLYARGNPVVRWDPNGLIDERSIFDKAITESPSVLESALTMVNETVARNVEFGFVVDASMRTGPMATSNRPDQVDLTGQIIKHIGFNLVRETGGRLVATFHSHLAPGRHPIPGNRSKEFLLFNQLASTADSRLAHEYATPGYIVQPSMNRLIKVDAQGGPGRAILTGRDFVFWMQRARVGRALSAARARAVASALLAIPF